MIPKTIHYCWFGGNPLPKFAKKCIKSWKKYCPDYEIIEWNEKNFDLYSAPLYVQQAYEARKWAFVSDYVRLKVVFDNGGIYLDTDVEVIRNLDVFLNYKSFFGFETDIYIATGLGFGAHKNMPILCELMKHYEESSFVNEDGSYDLRACPEINTEVFVKHGLVKNNTNQVLDNGDVLIFSTDYFCPKSVSSGKIRIKKNTYTIHKYNASWVEKEEIEKRDLIWKKARKEIRRERIRLIPNIVLKKIIGEKKYNNLKSFLKKNI